MQTELADWQQTASLKTLTQIWNWLRQKQHSTQVVHCPKIVHCWLLLQMRQPWQNSCRQSSHHLITTPATPCTMLLTRFPRKCPIRIALSIKGFTCCQTQKIESKLSTNTHLVRICPEAGRWRYVLIFKIVSEINTLWQSVSSFWGCPNGHKHNLRYCRASGYEFHAQFYACQKNWNHLTSIFFSYQYTFILCKSLLEASLLSCTSLQLFWTMTSKFGPKMLHCQWIVADWELQRGCIITRFLIACSCWPLWPASEQEI